MRSRTRKHKIPNLFQTLYMRAKNVVSRVLSKTLKTAKHASMTLEKRAATVTKKVADRVAQNTHSLSKQARKSANNFVRKTLKNIH